MQEKLLCIFLISVITVFVYVFFLGNIYFFAAEAWNAFALIGKNLQYGPCGV